MIKKRSYYEKNGICTFHDFASELSYEELLAVNGGCGGGTTTKISQLQRVTNPTPAPTGGYRNGGSYTSTTTTSTGSCGGGNTLTSGRNNQNPENTSTSFGNNSKYQNAYNENDYHCDIYAWNLALDNGLDPTKGSKEIIDLNQNTVSDMCKKYFDKEDLSKGICKENSKGFAFYDGTDDGVFNPTHVEFYDNTNSSVDSFTKYSTDGIAKPVAQERSYSDARNKNWTFVAL